MEVGGGFICEVPDCVTEGGSSPGPLGAGLFSMPRFEPDTQKSGPRPHQRGKTSQPLHGANYFFADLSKFFLTFALYIVCFKKVKVDLGNMAKQFSFYKAKGPAQAILLLFWYLDNFIAPHQRLYRSCGQQAMTPTGRACPQPKCRIAAACKYAAERMAQEMGWWGNISYFKERLLSLGKESLYGI